MLGILSLLLHILSFLIVSTSAGRYGGGSGYKLSVDLKDPYQGSTSGNLVSGQSTFLSWDQLSGAPPHINLVLSNDDPTKANAIPFYMNADVTWRSVTANLPSVPPGSNYFIECDSPSGVWCGATNYFSVVAGSNPQPPPPSPSPKTTPPPASSSTPNPSSTKAEPTTPPPSSSQAGSNVNSQSASSTGTLSTSTSNSANFFQQQTTSVQVSVTITIGPSGSSMPASASENGSHKAPLGAIIGAALGGALLVIIIAFLIFILRRKRRNSGDCAESGSLTPFRPQADANLSEKGQLEALVEERDAAMQRKETMIRRDDRISVNSNTTLLSTEGAINARIEQLNQQILELRQRNSDLEHNLQPPPAYHTSTRPNSSVPGSGA